jgi:hypothetical protein
MRITLRQAQPISVKGLLTFQEFTRQALAKPFSRWGKGKRLPGYGYLNVEVITSLEIRFGQKGGMLALEFVPRTLSQAILGSLVADKLAGNKYRLCELPQCRKPFAATRRKPPKQYCSETHRVRAAMRRSRLRNSRKEGER